MALTQSFWDDRSSTRRGQASLLRPTLLPVLGRCPFDWYGLLLHSRLIIARVVLSRCAKNSCINGLSLEKNGQRKRRQIYF